MSNEGFDGGAKELETDLRAQWAQSQPLGHARAAYLRHDHSLEDVASLCEARARPPGLRRRVFHQSNHEGELVEWIQEAREKAVALVINPAAYGHTSIAILDSLKTLAIPIVECHLSNPGRAGRSPSHDSTVSLAATGVVSGFGAASYALAIEAAAGLAKQKAAQA